jgi:hypothetical protein
LVDQWPEAYQGTVRIEDDITAFGKVTGGRALGRFDQADERARVVDGIPELTLRQVGCRTETA